MSKDKNALPIIPSNVDWNWTELSMVSLEFCFEFGVWNLVSLEFVKILFDFV